MKKYSSDDRDVPESYRSQKVLQPEICLYHSVQHGGAQSQTVKYAWDFDLWLEKEPYLDLHQAYSETALGVHQMQQTTIANSQKTLLDSTQMDPNSWQMLDHSPEWGLGQ